VDGYLSDSPRTKFIKAVTEAAKCIYALKNANSSDSSKLIYVFLVFLGYAVTIIVEGGINTLEVIQNDIAARRPVVIIQVNISNSSSYSSNYI
jgi:hypothetical protein